MLFIMKAKAALALTGLIDPHSFCVGKIQRGSIAKEDIFLLYPDFIKRIGKRLDTGNLI